MQLFELTIKDSDSALDALCKALTDTSKLVRLMATVQTSKLSPSLILRQNICELSDTLAESYNDTFAEQFAKLEIDFAEASDGDMCLQQEIVNAITTFNVGQAEFMIPDLIAYFSKDAQFYELGHAILAIMFPLSSHMVGRDSLSKQQLVSLYALVKNSLIWKNDYDIEADLKSRGLPSDHEDMQNFIDKKKAK